MENRKTQHLFIIQIFDIKKTNNITITCYQRGGKIEVSTSCSLLLYMALPQICLCICMVIIN